MKHSYALTTLAFLLWAPPAHAFSIEFDWSGLKLCTSGNPNTTYNPIFEVKDVPAGTKFIRFKLVDKNVPSYNHGGGVVAWNGEETIPAGLFKYKSPCPPGGSHTYEWSATAQTKKNGGALGKTTAQRKYPE